MSAKKRHNPERKSWRGVSYKNGRRVRDLRDAAEKKSHKDEKKSHKDD